MGINSLGIASEIIVFIRQTRECGRYDNPSGLVRKIWISIVNFSELSI